MPVFTNMAPEVALEIAESERMLIRAWDLQRRGRADPHADPISDDHIDAAAAILEDLAPYLPLDHLEDVQHLVSIVRTRLELRAEQG